MLKISLIETSIHCRVVLEGRMVGTGIKKLVTLCARLKSQLEERTLIIDMKDVTLISQEGENALLQLISYGAKIRADGVLVKYILQQLAHRSKKQVSDLVEASLTSARQRRSVETGGTEIWRG